MQHHDDVPLMVMTGRQAVVKLKKASECRRKDVLIEDDGRRKREGYFQEPKGGEKDTSITTPSVYVRCLTSFCCMVAALPT
jgi:hypothetical protein